MAMYFGDQRPGGYDLAKREFYCPACLETQEPKIEIGELGEALRREINTRLRETYQL